MELLKYSLPIPILHTSTSRKSRRRSNVFKKKKILAASKPVAAGLNYQAMVIADGAASYWPMNDVSGTIMDLAGTRHATVTGTPTYGVPGPRVATTISFARTGSEIGRA